MKIVHPDKWLPCVPYLQIFCFTMAFYPVHSSILQAINAMGRSDIFLKLEIIKKIMGISVLAVAVFAFDTPIAIAASGILTTLLSFLINSFPNKKLIGYSYLEQIKDILPSLLLAAAMCLTPLAMGHGLWQWFSFLSLPLLALYNGKRGKADIKNLFYIYLNKNI